MKTFDINGAIFIMTMYPESERPPPGFATEMTTSRRDPDDHTDPVERIPGRLAVDDLLHIVVPGQGEAHSDIDTLQREFETLDGVAAADSVATRSLEPATAMIVIQLISGVLGAVATAVPLIQKIREVIRGKGISGAIIKLPNGVEISIDNATATEIERILNRVGRVPK
jgi:hypothetical protein